jgi:cysteinyl-tRNA synthetase
MMYSQAGLKEARRRLGRLRNDLSAFKNSQPSAHGHGGKVSAKLAGYEAAFKRRMNDDFDAPRAVMVLEDFASELARVSGKLDQHAKSDLEARFGKMADVLGILS